MDNRTRWVTRCIKCGAEYKYYGDGLGEKNATEWLMNHKPWACERERPMLDKVPKKRGTESYYSHCGVEWAVTDSANYCKCVICGQKVIAYHQTVWP
jgi:hypothetical protein